MSLNDDVKIAVTAIPPPEFQAVDEIVGRLGSTPDAVIPILQAIQERFQYLPEAALRRVCETTEITPASITGVATFYSQFRFRPAGRHRVKVCIGTACHVKGAEGIYDAFRSHLGISGSEDTDSERLFTVEKVACLGCCMLAPAVQIDDLTYGFLTPEKIPHVVRDFLASASGPGTGDEETPSASPAGEVRICLCSSCSAAGTAALHAEMRARIHRERLPVRLRVVGCTGMAYQAPLVEVAMADGRSFRYGRVRPDQAGDILHRHFRPAGLGRRARASVGRLLERLAREDAREGVTRFSIDLRSGSDASYAGPQCRMATEHGGELPPLDLDAYVRTGGFSALARCLEGRTREEVLREILSSGLRGRGGAGFPTGRKWEAVASTPGPRRIVICNGDEGDPGAFMDRMILESFPFRVLEGLAIAAHTVGAREGLLYIRAEYPLALARIREAIAICREAGYLGEKILGSDFSLELKVVAGAGAFVCGEETALIAAIEGRRGTPALRPPYPAQEGLWGLPTLVNNVETFALVPWILREGAERFASLGTGESRGSKTFALAGKVVRSGLIEVPMGITLRQVVEEIGGGVPGGRRLKAIQVGGPSGGCVPASLVDTPVDYEALSSAGAIMGSGGMVVLDEDDCMVDIARYFMEFTQSESCGKCTCCRVGTRRMLDILRRLCEGHGKPHDLEDLERLAELVQRGSVCGLGRTAPNPVLSTLRHFREEYEAHLRGECPAGKCRALVRHVITGACIGCTRCAQACPVKAIAPAPYRRHSIDESTCIQCGACRATCPSGAVRVQPRGQS